MQQCLDDLDPFFFSSRRRHTRLVSDWSSDVCSSDLEVSANGSELPGETNEFARALGFAGRSKLQNNGGGFAHKLQPAQTETVDLPWKDRSEERRVGKEGGTGWSTAHSEENIKEVCRE